jgi:hypothetical protein
MSLPISFVIKKTSYLPQYTYSDIKRFADILGYFLEEEKKLPEKLSFCHIVEAFEAQYYRTVTSCMDLPELWWVGGWGGGVMGGGVGSGIVIREGKLLCVSRVVTTAHNTINSLRKQC